MKIITLALLLITVIGVAGLGFVFLTDEGSYYEARPGIFPLINEDSVQLWFFNQGNKTDTITEIHLFLGTNHTMVANSTLVSDDPLLQAGRVGTSNELVLTDLALVLTPGSSNMTLTLVPLNEGEKIGLPGDSVSLVVSFAESRQLQLTVLLL